MPDQVRYGGFPDQFCQLRYPYEAKVGDGADVRITIRSLVREYDTGVDESMSDTATTAPQEKTPSSFLVSSAPHLASGRTTRGIMFDVVLAMVPLLIASLMLYKHLAVIILLATVGGCLVTEAVFNRVRGRGQSSLMDGSAIVTGMILAFSLPPHLDAYMAFIGGAVAIALGKMIFGGLGQNLFNPAMVGRAFLMACFAVPLTTWTVPGTLETVGTADAVTQATPLAAAKFSSDTLPAISDLFLGDVSGCLGESSVLAVLIGGIYLLVRGTADWRQPLAMLVTAAVFVTIAHAAAPDQYAGMLYHLNSGALMFGAFFIATDYVGSPLTPIGRFIFGAGVGALVMVIRLFGGYPEGVMFAILIMNSLTPLIERWTTPVPFGGHVPA